jgi:hypothetical protein
VFAGNVIVTDAPPEAQSFLTGSPLTLFADEKRHSTAPRTAASNFTFPPEDASCAGTAEKLLMLCLTANTVTAS